MKSLPSRPPVQRVFVGRIYTYEGCGKTYRKKRVKVVAEKWPGSSALSDSHLVHAQLVGKKGELLGSTFGCDPRWLTDGGLSPYSRYHNELAKENKNILPVKEGSYLKDAEEEFLEDDGMGGADLFVVNQGSLAA